MGPNINKCIKPQTMVNSHELGRADRVETGRRHTDLIRGASYTSF